MMAQRVNLNAFVPVGVLATGGVLNAVPYRPYYPNGVKRTRADRAVRRARNSRAKKGLPA